MATSACATVLLLNVGHALDHLVLLVFATAVVAIAPSFGRRSPRSWRSGCPGEPVAAPGIATASSR